MTRYGHELIGVVNGTNFIKKIKYFYLYSYKLIKKDCYKQKIN